MFRVDTDTGFITMSTGDTGEITFRVEGYDFSDLDYRFVFAVRSGGKIIKENYYQLDDEGRFVVYVVNSDTDTLGAATCFYDVTVVIDPVFEGGRITDGSCVRTLIPPTRMTVRPAVRKI